MNKNAHITIGKLSNISGVSTDTIRYYEKMGVLGEADRASNGYRVYGSDALEILLFIRRAKLMNFTLEEIKQLLTMQNSEGACCGDVLEMVETKVTAFKAQLVDMQVALSALETFAHDCPGGKVPTSECPFIEYLEKGESHA